MTETQRHRDKETERMSKTIWDNLECGYRGGEENGRGGGGEGGGGGKLSDGFMGKIRGNLQKGERFL